MFPESSPLSEAVLSAYDKLGLAGAMAEFCRAHGPLPPAPHYQVEIDTRSGDQINRAAKRVLSQGFKLGKRPAFSLSSPVDWKADPFSDRSWCFWLNSLHPLRDVLAAHQETKSQEQLRFAQSLACDWIRANAIGDESNPFAWYDMAVGLRAVRLAYLVDASARDSATDASTLWALLRGAWEHGQHLADARNFNSLTNHGIFQAFGLAAIARSLPEFSTAQAWRALGEHRLRTMFARYFSEEGVHLEHSPAYHLDMTQTLQAVLGQGLVADPRLQQLLRQAQSVTAWMIQPNGKLPMIGDSSPVPVDLKQFGSSESQLCPELVYALTHGARGRKPDQAYQIFPKAGYAVFRSHWPAAEEQWEKASYLMFFAGFHSHTHKHADDLSFTWWEAGRELLVDSGRYGYYYGDPKRSYCESTRAHNTIEVDGYDRTRDQRAAYGSGLKAWGGGNGAYLVVADVPGAAPQVSHRRTLVFAPGQWLVVLDECAGAAQHTYTQWFHFAPELAASLSGLAAKAEATGVQVHVLPLLATHQLAPILVKGQESPRLQGWTSYAQRTLTPNWALGYRATGQNVTIATVFTLGAESPTPVPNGCAVQADRVRLEWRMGATPHGLILDRKESPRLTVLGPPD